MRAVVIISFSYRKRSLLCHYKDDSTRAYRHTSNMCSNMDYYDVPHPSSGEEEDFNSSLQTHLLTPPMSDASNDTTPPAKPPRSADIPPDPTPRPPEWVWPYHEGLYGVCPTTGNTTLESIKTSRIRVASQMHTHLLSRPCTMGSRRQTFCGGSGSIWLLL